MCANLIFVFVFFFQRFGFYVLTVNVNARLRPAILKRHYEYNAFVNFQSASLITQRQFKERIDNEHVLRSACSTRLLVHIIGIQNGAI